MAESIKELIEKINQEGVQIAEEKAYKIQERAQLAAGEILNKARQEAEKIISAAQKEALDTNEKQKALLKQAGRDLLLVLRQEINNMLNRLVLGELYQMLEPEALFKILSMLIRENCLGSGNEISISLSKEDFSNFQEVFLARLKEEVKKEILLRPHEEIRAGFIISYDAGKSQFDFSDQALAEYIVTFLKPKLKDILQG